MAAATGLRKEEKEGPGLGQIKKQTMLLQCVPLMSLLWPLFLPLKAWAFMFLSDCANTPLGLALSWSSLSPPDHVIFFFHEFKLLSSSII